MKKLVIPLLIIGIIAGSHWFLPVQAQGGDCNFPPEDCAIIEAHATKMLDTSLLRVSNFTLSGDIDLPDPVGVLAQGSGQISLSQVGTNRLVLEITDPAVDETSKLDTKIVLQERLAELGYINATVELIDDKYIIDVATSDFSDLIVNLSVSEDGPPLFELVDFADIPASIGAPACIITDFQVERGLIDRLCEDGSQPIGIDGQPGGTPFHTIITGDMVRSAEPQFNQSTNGWGIQFTLNEEGTQIFADYTEANVGEGLAVVIDGVVVSVPHITQQIPNGEGSISASFTKDEARFLASQIARHTLPVSVQFSSSEIVGPFTITPTESSFTVNAFNFGTKQVERNETAEIIFSGGTLTINTDDAYAPTMVEVGNDNLARFLDNFAFISESLTREPDVEISGQSVAVFRSEVPLSSVFDFEPAALLNAKLLTHVLYTEPDFVTGQYMVPTIENLFVENFDKQITDETVVIYRYISMNDFALKRLVIETEFSLPVMILESIIEGLDVGENMNDLTAFRLSLQVDFE
ncbi:MAG: hypothetical protein HY862_16930 [Chloroflexi bacterium]|nr:hypothetical protein [Chloroflexota bacterium]